MIEWILVVWLVVGGELAPAFEVGAYRQEDRCTAAAASIRFERADVEFIALCVERDRR